MNTELIYERNSDLKEKCVLDHPPDPSNNLAYNPREVNHKRVSRCIFKFCSMYIKKILFIIKRI